MQAILDLRARYKEKFEKEHGIKLGFTSFFVKAALAAASNADRKNVWESETIPGTFQRRRNYGLVGRVEYAGDWATLTSLTAYRNNLYSLRADYVGESNFPFQTDDRGARRHRRAQRSEEHTSELQSLLRI